MMGKSSEQNIPDRCTNQVPDTAAAFITSKAEQGIRGVFTTPAEDLSVERFAKVLAGHPLGRASQHVVAGETTRQKSCVFFGGGYGVDCRRVSRRVPDERGLEQDDRYGAEY